MDNLTHTLAGSALAKAGLARRTPLATATLVVAANAPDVDVLAFSAGPYAALAFRRGITHGVPAFLVLPLAVAGAVLLWDRRVRRRRDPDAEPARPVAVLALAYVGFLTHPVLDWMNSYGMRWWMPLHGGWAYGDSLFILDPWLWLALGAATWLGGSWTRGGHAAWAFLALALSVLVLTADLSWTPRALWAAALGGVVWAGAAGRTAGGSGRPRAAAALVVAASAYVGATVLATTAARGDVAEAAAREGLGPLLGVMVGPLPADPLRRDVVVRTPDGYIRGNHRWTASPRAHLDAGWRVPLRSGAEDLDDGEMERALALAVHEPDVRRYLAWARFPYYRVTREDGGYRVRVSDARYDGRRTGSLGGVEVYVPAP